MRSLVTSALFPPDADPGSYTAESYTAESYTAEERANIEVILKLRSVSFSERKQFLHPRMRHHRFGFASLGVISGLGGAGYDAQSISGRVDTIEDIIAKGDRVWAIWTMRGTHTGRLFGIAPTGRTVEVLEAGVWRLQDGLVAEAWFFGDELALLRQLGVITDDQVLAPQSPR